MIWKSQQDYNKALRKSDFILALAHCSAQTY